MGYDFYRDTWHGPATESQFLERFNKAWGFIQNITNCAFSRKKIPDNAKYCLCELIDAFDHDDVKAESVGDYHLEFFDKKNIRSDVAICRKWLSAPINYLFCGLDGGKL